MTDRNTGFLIFGLIVVMVMVIIIFTNSSLNSQMGTLNNIYIDTQNKEKSTVLSELVANVTSALTKRMPSLNTNTGPLDWLCESGEEIRYYHPGNFNLIIVYPQTGLVQLFRYLEYDVLIGRYDVSKDVPPANITIDGICWKS